MITLELFGIYSLVFSLPPCLLLSAWHLFCCLLRRVGVGFPSSMKKELNEVALKQVLGSRLSCGKKASRTRTHTQQARPNFGTASNWTPPQPNTKTRERWFVVNERESDGVAASCSHF